MKLYRIFRETDTSNVFVEAKNEKEAVSLFNRMVNMQVEGLNAKRYVSQLRSPKLSGKMRKK